MVERGGERKGRKRKLSRGGGVHSTRENVKQWTSIKSARDRGTMCVAVNRVWERAWSVFLHECFSVFALCELNMHKGSITQQEHNPSHDAVTSFWNRPSGLQGLPEGFGVFMNLKCLYCPVFFIALKSQKIAVGSYWVISTLTQLGSVGGFGFDFPSKYIASLILFMR